MLLLLLLLSELADRSPMSVVRIFSIEKSIIPSLTWPGGRADEIDNDLERIPRKREKKKKIEITFKGVPFWYRESALEGLVSGSDEKPIVSFGRWRR